MPNLAELVEEVLYLQSAKPPGWVDRRSYIIRNELPEELRSADVDAALRRQGTTTIKGFPGRGAGSVPSVRIRVTGATKVEPFASLVFDHVGRAAYVVVTLDPAPREFDLREAAATLRQRLTGAQVDWGSEIDLGWSTSGIRWSESIVLARGYSRESVPVSERIAADLAYAAKLCERILRAVSTPPYFHGDVIDVRGIEDSDLSPDARGRVLLLKNVVRAFEVIGSTTLMLPDRDLLRYPTALWREELWSDAVDEMSDELALDLPRWNEIGMTGVRLEYKLRQMQLALVAAGIQPETDRIYDTEEVTYVVDPEDEKRRKQAEQDAIDVAKEILDTFIYGTKHGKKIKEVVNIGTRAIGRIRGWFEKD